MALRPPGSRSNIDLVIFGALAMGQVLLLILGHVLIGYLLLGHLFSLGKGMPDVVEATGLPAWSLWLLIVATVAMDGWILQLKRQARKKALQR